LYEDVVSNFILASRYRDYVFSDLEIKTERMLSLDEALKKYGLNASLDMGTALISLPVFSPCL
jgi:hypothetical protein